MSKLNPPSDIVGTGIGLPAPTLSPDSPSRVVLAPWSLVDGLAELVIERDVLGWEDRVSADMSQILGDRRVDVVLGAGHQAPSQATLGDDAKDLITIAGAPTRFCTWPMD